MSKEAMKLALEALEYIEHNYMSLPAPAEKAITALREALAKPDFWEGYVPEPVKPAQREPVAGQGKELSERLKLCARNVAFVAAGRVDMSSAAMQEMFALIDHVCVGLDSPPAQRTWVHATEWRGLTDEEVIAMSRYDLEYAALIGEVQRRLKEKNT